MSNSNAVRSAQSGPFTGRRKSAAVVPGAITTLQTITVDFPLAEAAPGDVVSFSFDGPLVAGIVAGAAYIAAAGHVRIPFLNITAGTLTQTSIGCNVQVGKGV